MITYKKLKTFKKYKGIYEYFIRGSWFLFDRLRESEFVRIEELMKEARMLQKNEVSPDVAEVIRRTIETACDNQKTIDFLYTLALDDKFFPPVWFPPS
jgi:hypothetical protein